MIPGANFRGENWRVAVRLCFSGVASHLATTTKGLSQSSSFAHQQRLSLGANFRGENCAGGGRALFLRRRVLFEDDRRGSTVTCPRSVLCFENRCSNPHRVSPSASKFWGCQAALSRPKWVIRGCSRYTRLVCMSLDDLVVRGTLDHFDSLFIPFLKRSSPAASPSSCASNVTAVSSLFRILLPYRKIVPAVPSGW